jgi:hypothetical protein
MVSSTLHATHIWRACIYRTFENIPEAAYYKATINATKSQLIVEIYGIKGNVDSHAREITKSLATIPHYQSVHSTYSVAHLS